MRRVQPALLPSLLLLACGGGQPAQSPDQQEQPAEVEAPASPAAPPDNGDAKAGAPAGDSSGDPEFVLRDSDTAKDAHGATESKIKPTKTEAAVKFIVVDKNKNEPIPGIVISLTAPDGSKYYTKETDSTGYAEVLVPVGKKYQLIYLSLGRTKIAASVPVADEPNQNIKLTLRYKRFEEEKEEVPRFVLDGVEFDTGKATIRKESFPRLDSVVEYMQYKSSSRIRISGHTDNVGDANKNKDLSKRRAEACRAYLISKGIDGSRIEAVGYGDEQPIADNGSAEGRQKNRRIEASEL